MLWHTVARLILRAPERIPRTGTHDCESISFMTAWHPFPREYKSLFMPPSTVAVSTSELYADHQGWLKLWVLRRVGCGDEAADLVQDTFIRILHRQRQEDSFVIHYPRTYLRMVANSLLVDYFRRRKVEQAYVEALKHCPQDVGIDPQEREMMLETLLRLDKMLDTLSPTVRQTFLLSRLDGLSYPQIALQLGISLRTVKRYMQQAYVQCLDLML